VDVVVSAFEHHWTGCYHLPTCTIYWSDTDPIGADLLYIFYGTLSSSEKKFVDLNFERVS
jgi:hypothetical protein